MRASRDDVEIESPEEEDQPILIKDGESATAALRRALKEDLAQMGGQAISLLRTKHPQDYVKIILSLETKTGEKEGDLNDFDVDELRALLLAARAARSAHNQP